MSSIFSKTIVSCKQAALLGAKKSFGSLSLVEQLQLKWHLRICTCPTCHSFSKDSEFMDEALVKIIKQRESEKVELSDEQREKILKALEK